MNYSTYCNEYYTLGKPHFQEMGRETLKQGCYAESVILPYLNRNILRVKSITLDLNRSDSWSTHTLEGRVGLDAEKDWQDM